MHALPKCGYGMTINRLCGYTAGFKIHLAQRRQGAKKKQNLCHREHRVHRDKDNLTNYPEPDSNLESCITGNCSRKNKLYRGKPGL
jgi:hypothetical protein